MADPGRDRRNLTDADIVRLVAELDKRRTRAEVASIGGTTGGRGRNSLAQSGAKLSNKSADETAAVIGISARKVERTRTVLDKAATTTS